MSEPLVQLHFSGDRYFERALEAIASAKEEVLLESYIFDMDPIGLRFFYALEAAHSRGVKVRLLVDGIGSFNWLRELRARCQGAGIALRVYHPLPFSGGLRLSWKNLRRYLFFIRKINRRNHRKVILIDRKIVFMGSLNITKVHTEEFMDERAWRDTGIELRFHEPNHETALLAKAFDRTWRLSALRRLFAQPTRLFRPRSGFRFRGPKPSRFRLNSRPWSRYIIFRDLINQIRAAESRILITNAYFVPRRSMLVALRQAARRGIFVGLILPEKTDVWFVRAASQTLYRKLIEAGVHLYEYKPRVLHAKTLVIDDWAAVGSHNMNHRSMLHDLEVETVITSADLIGQLVEQWDHDASVSKLYRLRDLTKFPWHQRGLSRVLYWFRYWL
ncbi:MAG: phospholipase D-like domain-containing protein [Bdellovibrio sp.]|jgi:cardiolipin synthase